MDYTQKYIKYKNKYLRLKQQIGGDPRVDDIVETSQGFGTILSTNGRMIMIRPDEGSNYSVPIDAIMSNFSETERLRSINLTPPYRGNPIIGDSVQTSQGFWTIILFDGGIIIQSDDDDTRYSVPYNQIEVNFTEDAQIKSGTRNAQNPIVAKTVDTSKGTK